MAALAVLLCTPAQAQRLNIRTYANDAGLPQQQVLAVYQDAAGYLWFGTYAGLSRFDGRILETYTVEDGLPTNIVRSLAGAPGGLVVGTSAGLCFFDFQAFACLGPEDGLPDGDVRHLLVDPDGTIWAATAGGITRIRPDGVRTFVEADGLPAASTTATARGPAGRLWAGTDAGLAVLDGDRFVPVPSNNGAVANVQALATAPDGLLVGSASGLFLLHDGVFEAVPLPPVEGSPIFNGAARGMDGDVWLVSEQLGALRYHDGALQRLTRESGLPTEQVYSVLVDREGSVWLGTTEGAVQYVPGPFTVYGQNEGIPDGVVRAVVEDDAGRLWLGTRAGVAVFDGRRFRRPVPLAALPDPRVYALGPAPGGGMLIGTENGLVWWDGAVRAVYGAADGLQDTRIRSLLRDPDGGVWVGTRNGLAHWDAGRLTTFPASSALARLDPLDMRYDLDGRLWMGLVSGGAAIWDGDAVTFMGAAQGLTDQAVWALDRDGQGRMWVGSNGDGAFRVDPASGEILRLTARDGLVNNFVWSVLCDARGAVWLYTNQGLMRYADREWHHYGRAAGLEDLEGNAAAAWATGDGTLWFAAASTLARYDPAADRINAAAPPVVMGPVSGPDGRLERDGTLPYGFPGATFSYAALSYRSPERLAYRYRLLGLSREWSVPTADRAVNYAGLGPGNYEFQVMARNEDGVWSPEPATFAFTVTPAVWQTWWFRLVVLLVFVGLVAAVVRGSLVLRTHRLEAERSRLEELVRRNTVELREKNVSLEREMEHRREMEERLVQSQKMEAVGRLAGGVAHDFNNVMTTIIGFSDLIDTELGDGNPVHEELAEVKKAAERAARLTRQLLTFSRKELIRPRLLDLSKVVAESGRMLRHLIREDVALELCLEEHLGSVRADRSQLEQLLVNLAVNARDAMPEGGTLTIATANVDFARPITDQDGETVRGAFVSLKVTDTGMGITAVDQEHIFEPFFTTKRMGEGTGLGLATVYGIVKQNHAHVLVETTPGVGTTFSILFPRVEAVAGRKAERTDQTALPPS